jgi:hypothetical protein
MRRRAEHGAQRLVERSIGQPERLSVNEICEIVEQHHCPARRKRLQQRPH